MKIDLITKDEPFIASLSNGVAFRRSLVKEGHAIRNGGDDLCDSPELLSELVNNCFWASLSVEEGRGITGSLCVCSPDQSPRARVFLEPIPLSTKNIAILLTAAPLSPLAVHATKDGLRIWGLLDAAPMFALMIRIADAGTVIASEGGNILAILERGEVRIPNKADDFNFIMLVANALDKERNFTERMQIAYRLRQIVLAVHLQGHGGTLVVVPFRNDACLESVSIPFLFDSESEMCIFRLLNELENAKKQHAELEKNQGDKSLLPLYERSIDAHRSLLNSLLRSIGDLSAIDGAVVINEELKILGFGAKLEVGADNFDVLVFDALSGEQCEKKLIDLGGTRHQSAARFVFKNPEAMVFVSSQDGRLTLFAWVIDSARVVAVCHLEHLVREYRP